VRNASDGRPGRARGERGPQIHRLQMFRTSYMGIITCSASAIAKLPDRQACRGGFEAAVAPSLGRAGAADAVHLTTCSNCRVDEDLQSASVAVRVIRPGT
jgi:hypothetical protein